jgi:hypothetical protein
MPPAAEAIASAPDDRAWPTARIPPPLPPLGLDPPPGAAGGALEAAAPGAGVAEGSFPPTADAALGAVDGAVARGTGTVATGVGSTVGTFAEGMDAAGAGECPVG